MAAACLLVARSLGEEAEPTPRFRRRPALALASAVTVALLISVLATGFGRPRPARKRRLSAAGRGTPGAPGARDQRPGERLTTGLYLVNGMLLMGPAFALYWRGLRTVRPTAAGVSGLSEAPIAAAIAAVIFGATFPPGMLLAGAMRARRHRGRAPADDVGSGHDRPAPYRSLDRARGDGEPRPTVTVEGSIDGPAALELCRGRAGGRCACGSWPGGPRLGRRARRGDGVGSGAATALRSEQAVRIDDAPPGPVWDPLSRVYGQATAGCACTPTTPSTARRSRGCVRQP